MKFMPLRNRSVARIAVFALSATLCVAPAAAIAQQPNAPDANRKAIAELIRKHLADEVDGKEFPARTTSRVRIGVEFDAVAEARMKFVEPQKKLVVTVPTLQNRGEAGMRMVCHIEAPLQAALSASAAGINATANLSADAQLKVEADVKLRPAANNQWTAEIEIRSLDGSLANLNLGDANANAVLRPLLTDVANKIISDNRDRLKELANAALRKAAVEGRLHFQF